MFTGDAWKEVSEEGKDFVMKMLSKEPEKRASAAQLLKHSWMQNRIQLIKPEEKKRVFSGLKKFRVKYLNF